MPVKIFAVQLNDSIIAVALTEERANKIAAAVGEHMAGESNRFHHVAVHTFDLDRWPTHWAGEEPEGK